MSTGFQMALLLGVVIGLCAGCVFGYVAGPWLRARRKRWVA